MPAREVRPIGVFGGMFDPIHIGHLRPALEILEQLNLECVRFVPCARPPHRADPDHSVELRARLVQAAIADQPGFELDEREMRRAGPSFTVDTLAEMRAELGDDRPLCLLLGMDAFLGLPRWHRWEDLFELAHVVVMQRPGSRFAPDKQLAPVLAARRVAEPDRIAAAPAGCIFVQIVTQLEVSSTDIRARLARGQSVRYLMPEAEWDLLREAGGYDE